MADTWCKRAELELILRSFNNDVEAALCCKSQRPVSLYEDGALEKVRNDLANGVRNQHCSVCWLDEANGVESWRIQGNLTPMVDKSIEIYLDNFCDQKCIYCSPKYSSQWAKEIEDAEAEDKKFLQRMLNDDTFVATQRENHIKRILEEVTRLGEQSRQYYNHQIVLLGGEPLISPHVKKNIIDDVVEAFYLKTEFTRNLKILIVTNGNSPDVVVDRTIDSINSLTDKYENLKFTINISMEATGKTAEYIRYGLNYAQFLKNYKRYLDNNFEVGFSMTMNNVSFFDTPNFLSNMIDIAKKSSGWRKRTFFRLNVARYPKFLSIAVLPEEYRYIFDECKQIIKDNQDTILDGSFVEDWFIGSAFAEKIFGSDENKKSTCEHALRYFDYLNRTRGIDINNINSTLYKVIEKATNE